MRQLKCEYIDENGVRQNYKLQPDDIILVDRCVKSFVYSHKSEFTEYSVQEAIDKNVFSTEHGTVSVSAKIKFTDGTTGSVWMTND